MTLLTLTEAQSLVLGALAPLAAQDIPIQLARGRVLATPVDASLALPQGDVSIMDGYAIVTAGATAQPHLQLVGESAAGHPWTGALAPEQACRISTGALLPPGADAVIAQEDTRVDDGELFIDPSIRSQIEVGRHVRPAGADVRQGERLANPGVRLNALDVALIAAQGESHVATHRVPRVQILSTGDELIPVGHRPQPHQVVDTNAAMIAALCAEAGAEVVGTHHAVDRRDELANTLAQLHSGTDVLVTCGGASVGDHDLLRPTLAQLHAQVLCWGIAMRPGKPTAVLRWGHCWVFVLPGNPASALVAFELLVRPALSALLGVHDPLPTWTTAVAATAMPGAGTREHFVRARRDRDQVAALGDQRSGNLRSLVGAQALVRVPAHGDGLKPGDRCHVLDLHLAP